MRKIKIDQTTSQKKIHWKIIAKIKKYVIENMEYDTVEDDLANKNTEDFIRRMYRNNVS